jgi:hypothetical protein
MADEVKFEAQIGKWVCVKKQTIMPGSMMDAAESAWSRVSGLPELTGQGVVLDTMQKGWMQRAAGLRR